MIWCFIMVKVAIVQPLYLPWMGYFGLIDIVDVFVFFDDVQFVHRSWQRRNRIKVVQGKWIWLSVPVIKKFGQKINEVLINNRKNWRKEHRDNIFYNYKRAPYFRDYECLLEEIYGKEWTYLSNLNIYIIKRISELLGIEDTEFLLSSNLKAHGQKTDRLIDILEKIGADEYISGPAAKSYIEPEKFRKAKIKLYWFNFNHPKYPQIYGEFISHLSVIDLIFNTGQDSMMYIRMGEKNSLEKGYDF